MHTNINIWTSQWNFMILRYVNLILWRHGIVNLFKHSLLNSLRKHKALIAIFMPTNFKEEKMEIIVYSFE